MINLSVSLNIQAGLVYSEKGSLGEILCKPKLMPIKSATLIAMEEREREVISAVAGGGSGIPK
jgi:hypothetical protein